MRGDAMSEIVSYRVLPNGTVRVRVIDGHEREATPGEWLALWRADPRLTVHLAGRSAG